MCIVEQLLPSFVIVCIHTRPWCIQT